ncbi:DUF308 domain-containing protein [Candidatus Saccharibacteria bacterium]|nr:DUF308 domain-containing protein [Candidatus Saccharibacteria bacterium]
MAKINRRFIDKHWLVFIVRGGLAMIFGFLMLFGGLTNLESVVATISILLLVMGIIDATSALYNSSKKHGWVNSVIDALIDVVAALALLFYAKNDLVNSLIIIAAYTFISGIIDVFHGFLSTVDPTDRFIRILAGVVGCVMGFVILNAGSFELMTFIRFFGVYLLIVGITSMIYGVHNRSQNMEDKIARSEAAKKKVAKKSAKKHTRKK